MRGTWGTHFSGRAHFHGTWAPPPKSESSASKIFRHSGMTVAFKTTSSCFSEDFRKARCYALLTRRSHGGYSANQRTRSAREDKGKPSPASLRLRGRGQMPDAQSGRLYIVRQLQVPGTVSTKVTGNHLLLRVTGRSLRCRSGSEIPDTGL